MPKHPDSSVRIRYHEEMQNGARIKVVSVGGGGNNAINRMIEAGMEGVEFIATNTDLQSLQTSKAQVRLQLGARLTRGLGAGANPEVGRRAALEDADKIIEALDGADMVFITAGLGGGTGTGAAPVIAALASQMGALTVAIVTRPFAFEGKRRMIQAERGLQELLDHVDTLIVIPNEKLLAAAKNEGFFESFQIADDVLQQAVRGISDIITVPGVINRDFADVRSTMAGMGYGVMGTASRSGPGRAAAAARAAITSPLLEAGAIDGARGILINITGSHSLKLSEVYEASTIIQSAAHEDANITFGAVLDEELGDVVKITVIATGFQQNGRRTTETQRRALSSDEGPTARFEEPASPVASAPAQVFTASPREAGQEQHGLFEAALATEFADEVKLPAPVGLSPSIEEDDLHHAESIALAHPVSLDHDAHAPNVAVEPHVSRSEEVEQNSYRPSEADSGTQVVDEVEVLPQDALESAGDDASDRYVEPIDLEHPAPLEESRQRSYASVQPFTYNEREIEQERIDPVDAELASIPLEEVNLPALAGPDVHEDAAEPHDLEPVSAKHLPSAEVAASAREAEPDDSAKEEEPVFADEEDILAYLEGPPFDLNFSSDEQDPDPVTEPPRPPEIVRLRQTAMAAYAAISTPEDEESEEPTFAESSSFAAILKSRRTVLEVDEIENMDTNEDEGNAAEAERQANPSLRLSAPVEAASPSRDTNPTQPELEANLFPSHLTQERTPLPPPPQEFFNSPLFVTSALPSAKSASLSTGLPTMNSANNEAPKRSIPDFNRRLNRDPDFWLGSEAKESRKEIPAHIPSFAAVHDPDEVSSEFDELDIPAFLRRRT